VSEGPAREPTVLPAPVRLRVVDLAAARLATLEADAVPHSLRAVARFTPAKRARLGGSAIAAALQTDADFRAAVVASVREATPDLVAAVEAGRPPAAADPVEVAAVAYLVEAPGWERLGAQAAAEVERREAASADAGRAVARLREQLEALRSEARAQAERLRADLATAKSEADDLRRQLRESVGRARKAEEQAASASATQDAERAAAAAAASAYEAEGRRLRTRIAEVEAAAQDARKAAREGRASDDARLWLLVDTLARAARGLREELALAPPEWRPADRVGGEPPADAAVTVRGHEIDDPALLDQLLGLPNAHLVADGYNVTKTGFPTLTLEDQRQRLVAGLGSLAARTGAEVTCVFDGADGAAPAIGGVPRQVRVLFSAQGEIADDLIRRIVRAEPPGRPVVVVTADREVVEDVRRAGAYTVSPLALLRRLDRA
jgi:predicted RNA-binding protein with PIN domain